MSNLYSNGSQVVIGAANVDGQSFVDGAYRLTGDTLVELASPGSDLYGPTVSRKGRVVAIHSGGGFAVRSAGTGHWRTDPRFRKTLLSPLAWGVGGNAFAIARPNGTGARLVELKAGGGTRRLRGLSCASATVASAVRPVVATTPPVSAGGPCAHARGRVVNLRTGTVTKLPIGWRALSWSRNSRELLVSRDRSVGVWDLSSHRIVATAPVGVSVWMAAPVWK